MITSFGDKDAEAIFHREYVKTYSIDLIRRIQNKLAIIDAAYEERDLMMPPGNCYERLRGNLKGYSSIRINDQWRIVFIWKDGNASDVKIVDYH